MNLIVLDTETSDLPENGGSLMELAWFVMGNEGQGWKPIASHETYIQYDGPINPMAQASHHIRADQCTAAKGAVPKISAIARIQTDIESDDFLVAHNKDFDSKFLPELNNPWICTYRCAKRIWPEAPGYSNQVLRYWLGIKPDLSISTQYRMRMPHQALYDVATTAGLLQRMLEKHTPQELYEFTGKPVKLKTINFGKHKGTPFDQVPRDYLAWLRGQQNLDQDLKFTLDSILQS